MVTEQQLIQRTREAGKAFLRRKPKAFGGGIDPETGIRKTSSGQRVSVTTAAEEAAGVTAISREQAVAVETQERQREAVELQKKLSGITAERLRQENIKKIFTNQEFQKFQQANAPRFRVGLSRQEERMGTGAVVRGRFKEVGIGLAQASIKTAEGTVNLFGQLGVKKIEPGQKIGFFGVKGEKKFRFGGKLGEIRDAPTTTGTILGQTLLIAPLIGAAGAGFGSAVKAEGIAEATRQTITSFSPFKIKSGTFGALETQASIDKLKFDVVSAKKTVGDVTVKRIVGTAKGRPDITVTSTQVSKGFGSKEVGKAVTDITAPRTTFRAGRFEEGIRAVRSETFFTGGKGSATIVKDSFGVSLKGIQAGGAVGKTRTLIDLTIGKTKAEAAITPFSKLKDVTTGSISKRGTGFERFLAGKGSKSLRVSKDSISEVVKVKDFDITGIEFEAGKSQIGGGFSSVSKPGFTIAGLKKVTAAPIVSRPSVTTPIVTKTTGIAPTIAAISIKEAPGAVTKPALPKQKQAPQIEPVLKTETLQKEKTITSPRITTDTATRVSPDVATAPRVVTSPRNINRQISVPRVITRPLTTPKQIAETTTTQKTITSPRFIPIVTQIRPRETTNISPRIRFQPTRQPTRPTGIFGVQVRRGGIFRSIATTTDIGKAFSIGTQRVGSTLAATFKITGNGKRIKTPKGFRRKATKGGILFIERKGLRLSKTGETKEITRAKKIKRKRKKKKK